MTQYMVERYLPGVTQQSFEELRKRIAAAAEKVSARGAPVRYVGSTFVPEEESCFCRFESASADGVRRACEQAGVSFARIFETHDFTPPKKEER
jgi:hypothetical protein